MVMLPLKQNKETSNLNKDILLEIVNKNWIGVIGDNALRLLIQFNYQENKGEALIGDYDYLSKKLGKARGSIADGVSELQALGFLKVKRIINRKTKIYEINKDICYLSEKWVAFFSETEFKKLCLKMLLDKPIENSVIDTMQLNVVNSNDKDLEKTLGRLLYLYIERKGFTIEDLLEEERTKMQEDLFPNGFGFGEESEVKDNWQSVLTDEEKNDKELMKVLIHYVSLVDYPTRSDIDLIKKALIFCYAYQIKNVITHTKNHPKYGASFKSFKYVYNQAVNGQCGTRRNNKAKDKFNNEKTLRENSNKRVNNQTDFGFKNSGVTRDEMIKRLNEAATSTSEDEAFDFKTLRR